MISLMETISYMVQIRQNHIRPSICESYRNFYHEEKNTAMHSTHTVTINESFTCTGCGKLVPPASRTCRNHCPSCFTSLHVDGDIPGDRRSSCQGTMKPVRYTIKHSQVKILFRCTACGKEHRNKAADDDDISALIDICANAAPHRR